MNYITAYDPWLPIHQAIVDDDVALSPPPPASELSDLWVSDTSMTLDYQHSFWSNLGQQQPDGTENNILPTQEQDTLFTILEPLEFSDSGPPLAYDDYASCSFLDGMGMGGADSHCSVRQYTAGLAGATPTSIIPMANGTFGSFPTGGRLATPAPAPPPLSPGKVAGTGSSKKLYQLNPDFIEDRVLKARVINAIKAKNYRENLKNKIKNPDCIGLCKLDQGPERQQYLEMIKMICEISNCKAGSKKRKTKMNKLGYISKGRKN